MPSTRVMCFASAFNPRSASAAATKGNSPGASACNRKLTSTSSPTPKRPRNQLTFFVAASKLPCFSAARKANGLGTEQRRCAFSAAVVPSFFTRTV